MNGSHKPAKVILLNGVSSAGKTTLAREIQARVKETFLHVEMDKFISFLPDGDEFKPEWFRVDRVQGPLGRLPRISNGPSGAALLSVMRQFVINAGQKGLNMVVDEVCHASEIADYGAGLAGRELCIAKVFAPIDVIEARERARGDRLVGLALEQSSHLHEGIVYDREVDTGEKTSDALARELLAAVND
ncbi:MAG: chloramphenicol phosphotransferase [Pseudomonadota bacterium]